MTLVIMLALQLLRPSRLAKLIPGILMSWMAVSFLGRSVSGWSMQLHHGQQQERRRGFTLLDQERGWPFRRRFQRGLCTNGIGVGTSKPRRLHLFRFSSKPVEQLSMEMENMTKSIEPTKNGFSFSTDIDDASSNQTKVAEDIISMLEEEVQIETYNAMNSTVVKPSALKKKTKAKKLPSNLSPLLLEPHRFFANIPFDLYWNVDNKTPKAPSSAAIAPTKHSVPPPSSSLTPLTVTELEAYLQSQGYIKQSDPQSKYPNVLSPYSPAFSNGKALTSLQKKKAMDRSVDGQKGENHEDEDDNKKKRPPSKVAFPQASVLKFSNLKWSCSIVSCVFGIVAGTTILPNLWMMGGIAGGIYGYDVGKKLPEQQEEPNGALATLIISCATRLAKFYLSIYDFVVGIWFMYKTGQLSYDYYQKYADLDRRFQIQSKMDAWNARFQEGKIAFDTWEKENEIGRKILAGARTLWLVEEKSRNKTKRKNSKVRIVRWYYKALGVLTGFVGRIARLFSSESSENWNNFFKGLQLGMSEAQWKNTVRPRIGSGLAAILLVFLTGALFTVSPASLALVAVIFGGIVWPTWSGEWFGRLLYFWDEMVAKGRDGIVNKDKSNLPWFNPNSRTNNNQKKLEEQGRGWLFALFGSEEEKEKYSFFKREDGSRRYYRTGGSRPFFQRGFIVTLPDDMSRKKRNARFRRNS